MLELPPSDGNPRNSEGDVVALDDGRLLFVYTKFTGGGSDFDTAHLAGRYSEDAGAAWSEEDTVILPNEGGQNTMSVSLLRLDSGQIALFYLRKNSRADCRPFMRLSRDDGETWSSATPCINRKGYYVVNNDRVVQLDSGRLIIPVAIHSQDGDVFQGTAKAACRISDDGGKTWRWSETILDAPADSRTGLQEPGVATVNGRLMMFCRTDRGSQYVSWSDDDGETWSEPAPSNLVSPVSPATIESLPGTDYLVAVYNDHNDAPESIHGKRTPLTLARSEDGESWQRLAQLETDPEGWYCYTAMHFTDTHMLLAYCAGNEDIGRLSRTRIVRIPLAGLLP